MFNAGDQLLWLQRDFGVFMVNLFDVQMALKLLDAKQTSFSDVLMSHMNEYINMRFRRADWRTRPLTAGMLRFARQTAHSTLYLSSMVIEQLRNESQRHINRVRDEDGGEKQIVETLAACNELCLETYHKPVQTYETGESTIAELGQIFQPVQKMLFLSLYYWRDVVARE